MTIICAVRTHGGVWIGSDSRMTVDGFVVPTAVAKWRKTERGIWWGVSGSARLIEVARKARVNVDMASGACELAEALRDAARDDGWSTDDGRHGCAPDFCFDVMIVVSGRVFRASGNGVVTDFGDEFAAEGSGRDFAYGAAHAVDRMVGEFVNFDIDNAAKTKVVLAVQAASRYDASCGGTAFVEFVPSMDAI